MGDNFIADTYRKNFKKASDQFFLKKHYDVSPLCSSRYNDKNSNMLSRLQHSLALGLNTKSHLPNYILVILDEDLIKRLQYNKFKVATLLGMWVEYIAKFIHKMIETCQKNAPFEGAAETGGTGVLVRASIS